jgi:hypothetical protein
MFGLYVVRAVACDVKATAVTDIRIVYVFVLSYTPYFHIVEVKYG